MSKVLVKLIPLRFSPTLDKEKVTLAFIESSFFKIKELKFSLLLRILLKVHQHSAFTSNFPVSTIILTDNE